MLYTVRGAAKYLGISRSALRNRIVAGEFPQPDEQVDRGNTVADVWCESTLVSYAAKHKLRGAANG